MITIDDKNNMMMLKNDDVQIFIIADDVHGMSRYMESLYKWATEVWDYENVEWMPESEKFEEEFLFVKDVDKNGDVVFYKIHQLMGVEFGGLFRGEFDDSPMPLDGVDDMNVKAVVYFKITEEEYDDLMIKYENRSE